jgi:murein tripeptide amidase MpaA
VIFPFAQVGERFKCLSYTLEMPFKDTQDHPDNVHGWSIDRARHFGAAILQPIYEVVPKLRQPVHKKEEDITVVHA